jgi:hypothetical protein
VRFQVLMAASMIVRVVFWDILPCKMIVDNHFTWEYIPEDNSEHHTHISFPSSVVRWGFYQTFIPVVVWEIAYHQLSNIFDLTWGFQKNSTGKVLTNLFSSSQEMQFYLTMVYFSKFINTASILGQSQHDSLDNVCALDWTKTPVTDYSMC